MNNKGVSFVETLLILAILLILSSTIVPLSAKLNESLYVRKLDLHVSQVAYNAAKQVSHLKISHGSEILDDKRYYWTFDGYKLCVNYYLSEKVQMKCFSQEDIL